jgi:hypothetical protein
VRSPKEQEFYDLQSAKEFYKEVVRHWFRELPREEALVKTRGVREKLRKTVVAIRGLRQKPSSVPEESGSSTQ